MGEKEGTSSENLSELKKQIYKLSEQESSTGDAWKTPQRFETQGQAGQVFNQLPWLDTALSFGSETVPGQRPKKT